MKHCSRNACPICLALGEKDQLLDAKPLAEKLRYIFDTTLVSVNQKEAASWWGVSASWLADTMKGKHKTVHLTRADTILTYLDIPLSHLYPDTDTAHYPG